MGGRFFSRIMPGLTFGRVLAGIFGLLVLAGIGAFGLQIFHYYRAIRSGDTNPLLEQRLESSFSRLRANTTVTAEDLKRLHPPTAPSFGNPEAKLVIVEFLDFDCPYCKESFPVVREMMEREKDRVYFIVRDFPVEELHPRALSAALAARCAQDQGGFWPYHDKLFTDQDHHEDADLIRFAREIGLQQPAFTACLNDRRHATQIQAEIADGLRAGVQGTPTFFFNGIKLQGALNRQTFEFLVKKFLERPPLL